MTIDAHAHIIPRDFPVHDGFPRMEAIDHDTARTLMFGTTNFRAKDVFFDVERRVEAMDAAGVTEEVVSPMPPTSWSTSWCASTGASRHRSC